MHFRATALVTFWVVVGEPQQCYLEFTATDWVEVLAGIMARLADASVDRGYPVETHEVRIISCDMEVLACLA